MRCALYFDAEKCLCDQDVATWGQYQSLSEDPDYKETDIKDPVDRQAFYIAKHMVDEISMDFDNYLDGIETEDEYGPDVVAIHEKRVITEAFEDIMEGLTGEICMLLYHILDNQEDDDIME